MTANEKRVVMAVFSALIEKPYSDLNKFLGSITIQEMSALYSRLRYEDYCRKHGITYEEMTETDFIQAYEEECDECERQSYEDCFDDEFFYNEF